MWNRVRDGRENDSFLTLFRMAWGFQIAKWKLDFEVWMYSRVSFHNFIDSEEWQILIIY